MLESMLAIIIREYLSKCECCDECVASIFCTLNYLRHSREPQDYCESNLKEYLKDRVKDTCTLKFQQT